MSGVIDFEEVRLFLMDRAVEDNALDLVEHYFSDEEILAAMRRAAQHFNELPPYVTEMRVSKTGTEEEPTYTLPYKIYLLNGVAYYVYLSKLQKLAKEDLAYQAGGMGVDVIGKRMKHFQNNLAMFKEEFVQGASADKTATNYSLAFGQVG